MNEKHPIDDFFREVVSPLEMAPSNKVWASIDKKLNYKPAPKKSYTKYYFIGGGAVLGALALFFTYTGLKNENEKKAAAKNNPVVLVQPTQEVAKEDNKTISVEQKTSSSNTNTVRNISSKPLPLSKTSESNQVVWEDFDKSGLNNNLLPIADRFEKQDPAPFVPSEKITERKDNSDKAILMMPYFPSENENLSSKQTLKNETSESAQTPVAATTKTPEKAENTIFVPNAFTPNGDGLNDVFIPQTAENVKEYKMSIYDRYGNLVYVSDDVHKGWDGRSIVNGAEMVKEDVYMWRIEFKNPKNEKEHLMGYLNLLK